MDVVTTTFTSFEKDCSSIPTPLTSYDPIISSKVAQIDIPIWAKIEPPAGKWDLEGAWRNVTPVETTTPPIPTEYPLAPSPNVLSSGAIIGIIVGSVFGTALMFIIAAVILWKCLGIGRYRQQPAEDIRVGRDMGYLDGEYVYVQPVNPISGPDGTLGVSLARRLTSRRDHRGGLRPRAEVDLDASDVSINRQLSDYESETGRPLRQFSRSPSYLGEPQSPAFAEPASPFSHARHASLDGKYRGYHPGASPQSVHRPSIDDRREGSYRHDDYYRPSREYRASGDQRRERDEREHRGSYSRSPPRFSQHRPSGDRFSGRGSADRYRSSRDRPISGQFSNRRPISGQFSYHRTSAERKRDHRVSVRSGLRPVSFESIRRSVDNGVGGSYARAEDRRPSQEGVRFSRDGRLSRDGGRSGRPSRDDSRYRKASLSEGEEDLAGLGGEVEESIEDGPRTTGSDYGHRREHLRKRSQSARTSCDPGHGLGLELRPDDPARPNVDLPVPPSGSSAPTTNRESTSNTGPVAGPSKIRSLRIANDAPESDPLQASEVSRPSSVMREPGLLARARTLLHSTPKSSRPSSSSSHNQPPSAQSAAPPSAWQRLRHIPSALSFGQPRTSTGSDSDATSAYHTAQGHTPLGTGVNGAGTPVNEFGNRTIRAGSALGQVPLAGSDEGYHQETDAGVQLVVGAGDSSEEGRPEPPAYAVQRESGPSQPAVQPQAQPNTSSHGHSDPASHVDSSPESSRGRHATKRASTLTRDTEFSTVSSGILQTWTSARRPTGFVGTGRVFSETSQSQIPVVNESGAEQEPRTSGATSREDALSGLDASSTAVSTFEQDEPKPEPLGVDVLSSEGSRETTLPDERR
ncbi:hypothetical protein FRC09_007888 [Ceratobasidium sp. 395]|nr:hypothetical protein FRC09_007888 [Ceratobasidium sp. 395]